MRDSRHSVSLRTYGLAFAVALSPALMQTPPNGCGPVGDGTLSMLEFEVSGQDQILLFNPGQPNYEVWLPANTDTAVLRAQSTDPVATVRYKLQGTQTITLGKWPNGGGETTIDGLIPFGDSTLTVDITSPGDIGVFWGRYTVGIHVGCTDCDDGNGSTADSCDSALQVCVHAFAPFPCTEQGIRDAIAMGGGPHTFDCPGPATVVTATEIVIDNNVILDGEGNLTLQGATVREGVTAELRGFTISVFLWNTGTLAVANSTVTRVSSTGHGPLRFIDSAVPGGVSNGAGSLTVTNSTVGGLDFTGSLTLTNSTVAGSILAWDFEALSATNSTVSAPFPRATALLLGAYDCGGRGCSCSNIGGLATVSDSTIQGYVVACGGSVTPVLTLARTILEGDCDGVVGHALASGGYNVESPGNTCGLDQATDLSNVPALNLGPLAENGGPTPTLALLPGSVAIDAIPAADCVLQSDQRGVTRPQDGACDAGAFEYADCTGSLCDDGNQCTIDHCDPLNEAWCNGSAVPDGLYCDFGGTNGVCVTGQCVATTWGTAELIQNDATSNGFDPRVAVDPNGDAMAVWGQENGAQQNVWANRYTLGVGWGPAELIQTDATSHAMGLELVVDSTGRATAVWDQRGVVWSNRYAPGVGWGAAEQIGSGSDAHLAVDPDGVVTVVSTTLGSGIWFNRFTPSGGWDTAGPVENNSGVSTVPQVVVDSTGQATAVWIRKDDPIDDVWASRHTPGIGWSAPEVIGNDTCHCLNDPSLGVDASGHVTAVWQGSFANFYSIWSNRYVPGVGWGAAELIETRDASAEYPRIAIAPDGHALAVWQQLDFGYDGILSAWFNGYAPGTGWGTPERLENYALAHATRPDVAVDPSGVATVVWVRLHPYDPVFSPGWDDVYSIWSNRHTPGAGWGVPKPITGSPATHSGMTNWPSVPRLAVDASGRATAVWDQGDGTQLNIWSNRSEAP